MDNKYQEVIDNLDSDKVRQLLEKLGIDKIIETDSYIMTNTICHHCNSSEASTKLYFYKNTKLFMCYSSCGGMSIFSFLKHYYEVRHIEYDWYSDIFEVAKNCSIERSWNIIQSYTPVREEYKFQSNIQLPPYDESVLDSFIKYYPQEWIEEGISKQAMDKYNIRYSISQNKIIIPHYDINGALIGIRGRALNKEEIESVGKYTPVYIENKWYTHKLMLNLYGLYQNSENIKREGICYIFEGEKSILKMDSFSIPNCSVAVCGNKLNKFQLKLLLKYCYPKEIVICFDKEEKPHEDTYFNKLYNLCNKYCNYCAFSFIYDRWNILEQKDAPVDKGEQAFIELLNKRVQVKG